MPGAQRTRKIHKARPQLPALDEKAFARSRTGISLIGFAVMPVSVAVAYEMHEWASQEQQIRQGGQDVTGMRPE
jgi:hypothetical protein